MTIEYKPIGVIHTPFTGPEGTPIQPRAGRGVQGTATIEPEYVDGLKDLDGFSHIILLYHLDRSHGFKLNVVPYLDDTERGLFATRSPRRPNPIGLSVVRLERIEGSTLHIVDLDILDGTPLLDIKPFVPMFEDAEDVRIGWLEGKRHRADDARADDRFHGSNSADD